MEEEEDACLGIEYLLQRDTWGEEEKGAEAEKERCWQLETALPSHSKPNPLDSPGTHPTDTLLQPPCQLWPTVPAVPSAWESSLLFAW